MQHVFPESFERHIGYQRANMLNSQAEVVDKRETGIYYFIRYKNGEAVQVAFRVNNINCPALIGGKCKFSAPCVTGRLAT